MRHYFNPLWTPDGSAVVAGYLEAPSGVVDADNPVSSGELAVRDFDTGNLRIVPMPDVQTLHRLYDFDPSGQALAFTQNGSIRLYDLQGQLLLNYQPAEGGEPQLMQFTNTGKSFVWIGGTPGNYSVNQSTYDMATWTVESEFPMMTLDKNASIISMVLTGQRSVAIRWDDGEVKEYDFTGAELNSLTTVPFTDENPWQHRLVYATRSQNRWLYVRDQEGIYQFDLETGEADQILVGHVVDFDVQGERASMVYETGTGDTWLATLDATPLTRIGPQNLMPRFSPAANGIATIERLDAYTDTLRIQRLK